MDEGNEKRSQDGDSETALSIRIDMHRGAIRHEAVYSNVQTSSRLHSWIRCMLGARCAVDNLMKVKTSNGIEDGRK